MKNVLIAGVSGNIGSYIYETLKNKFNLFGISRSYHDRKENIYKLDLTDLSEVEKYTEDCLQFDALIFFVALAHEKGENKNYKEFNKINVTTLKNLLNCLKKNKKLPTSIIFASTISVYGQKIYSDFYYEDSKKDPKTPYAKTKLEAENFLLKNFKKNSTILRISPVYSKKFFLNVDRRTKLRKFYYRVGSGEMRMSLCHMKNIRKVLNAILNETVPVGIYNISDSVSYSFNDLLKANKSIFVLKIPRMILWFFYFLGKTFGNLFLEENAIKLLSNNFYPSDKIRRFMELEYSIDNLK